MGGVAPRLSRRPGPSGRNRTRASRSTRPLRRPFIQGNDSWQRDRVWSGKRFVRSMVYGLFAFRVGPADRGRAVARRGLADKSDQALRPR